MTNDSLDTEVEITLRERRGRLSGHHQDRFVLLGHEFANSSKVRSGERWRVRLHTKTICLIAEPLELLTASLDQENMTRQGDESTKAGEPMRLQGRWIEPQGVIRKGERVAFFVDAAHTISAARSQGFKIDWQRVLDYFLADGDFIDACFYIGEWPDGSNVKLMEAISHLGFTIRRKPVKFVGAGDKQTVRISHDVEIALDMITAADLSDVAYLFSGDSDLEALVTHLRSRGKRIHIVSSKVTLSRELAMASNKPVYHLEHHRSLIEKPRPAAEVDPDAA